MENVKKLKFDSEDFEKYGTKRINIQNRFLKLKKNKILELLIPKKRNMVIKKLFYSWINPIYAI